MGRKDRIQKLKEQKSKIEARIQAIEARVKVKERKEDTRRKILVGSYYLDNAKKNDSMDEIKKLMDKYLVRDSDRKLFGLNPKK